MQNKTTYAHNRFIGRHDDDSFQSVNFIIIKFIM